MNVVHSDVVLSLLAHAAGTDAKVLTCPFSVSNLHANLLLYHFLYQLEVAGLPPYYLPLFLASEANMLSI